ncbi:putative tricarboxylic transport membrane protein [Prauserella alba]|uniref:Tripartite tricarboxylate transporter substrate-binding protein n=1 Tax=Prauserella alba TaxID=176898 RepID=A0ABP4G461_9PSEU|nr:putative tricarboxylic transport membrane protein [Prauserella alba]
MRPHGPILDRRRLLASAVAVASAAVAGSSCGIANGGADRLLRMLIPHSPGGGYDLTGRAAAKALEAGEKFDAVEITNVLGGGGTVALQRLLDEEGAEDLVLVMGLGVLGAVHARTSDVTPPAVTPIARLVEEQEGILVPAHSPLRTVDDLVAAWRRSPRSVTVGGGSTVGGPDHLFPMRLAAEVGIEPRRVAYRSFAGGGPLTSALIGGEVDVGVSSLGEVEGQVREGALRLLAVSGRDRHRPGAPTLTQSGIDLVFTNWRGVLAPPGISEGHRQHLIETVTAMHASDEWQAALARNGWRDNFATGDEFAGFLREQATDVDRTLRELGLT